MHGSKYKKLKFDFNFNFKAFIFYQEQIEYPIRRDGGLGCTQGRQCQREKQHSEYFVYF